MRKCFFLVIQILYYGMVLSGSIVLAVLVFIWGIAKAGKKNRGH